MTLLSRLILTMSAVFVALTLGAQTIKAQSTDPLDPVNVDPKHYKVIYENDEVRILRFDDTPGHKVPKHRHAHPFQVYSITPSLRQFYIPEDCKTPDPNNPVPVLLASDPDNPLPPGKPQPPLHPPVIHCEANVGVTDAHLIVVEYLKNPPPTTTATTTARRRPVKPLRRTRR